MDMFWKRLRQPLLGGLSVPDVTVPMTSGPIAGWTTPFEEKRTEGGGPSIGG